MKSFLSYLLKSVKVGSLTLIVGISLYSLSTCLLPQITINKSSYPAQNANHTIYIMTNGVHTDLVLPVRSNIIRWDTLVPFENTISKDTIFQWLAFGWGDKGFYLNTPTWDDLTFGTAFRAAAGLSTTAIHATYYYRVKEDQECIKIKVTDEQLEMLSNYIRQSFDNKVNGKFQYIATTAVYGKRDAFYEAKGNYSVFTTCNTWTNTGLKAAKLPACFWTPLDKGLMDLYSNLQLNK